jgi:hypothetical protein
MNTNGNDPGVKAAKPLAAELVWEVEGIAAELGLPTRVVYNLLRTRALPGQKVGGEWCSSRSALRKHFAAVLGEVA